MDSINAQTLQPQRVEVVVGVSPNGRARNVGVARTTGDILIFVDDDAILGDEHVLQNLVQPLLKDDTIGVTGASKLIPPDSSWFQRWVAREVPRIEHAVVDKQLETNPDPPTYYSEITTTCCAMRRRVFDEAGGFDEGLVRGVDTEFFVRVRTLGYRFVLVPQTWTWHPAPSTLGALLRKHFWYGVGHAQEVRRDPARAKGLARWPLLNFLFRTAILLPNVFFPFSYSSPDRKFGFMPLKAITSYTAAIGYTWEWLTGTE
ncbi:MAG TPA: glycosyltransferase [Candidatus Sulfomarinibacteraceae bacterium]|nr:glycosyltransferase [Candidatus Sulfomarinibacteraceae bacterium]